MSLATGYWCDDSEARVAAAGCDDALRADLKRFCAGYDWPN